MANIKAKKKDILRNKKNRLRNVAFKSKMRTMIKRARLAIEEKTEDKDSVLKETLRVIDKVSSKGIIHHKTASRYKSRLSLANNKA